jgi:hypothetical protein
MNEPTIEQRKEYADIVTDSASIVTIPGTRKKVRLHWVKPYTMERITKLWIERDLAAAKVDRGEDVLKDLCKEPYFAFKEAALFALNGDLKIRFFYPILWRLWAWRYNENQILPIIAEGKKKLPLAAHYATMAYSLDMRMDVRKMTAKEAEQYQAELLSAANRRL